MDKDIAVELIHTAPTLLALLLVLGVVWHYRNQIDGLLSRVGSIKAFGVEAQFAEVREQLDNAAKSYGLTVDDAELNKVVERANRLKDLLDNSRILWVDDRPLTNANIFRFLNAYGVVVDTTSSTAEAVDALQWAVEAYDVVVTDMVRDHEPAAGLNLIRELKERNIDKPVIIFVVQLDADKGVPPGAIAITNSPMKLIHAFMNCLESMN